MKDDLFYGGSFGIERETLRVNAEGRLAQTPHPFGDNEQITRDFCENQIEIVTPVCKSIDEALGELERLDGVVRDTLSERGRKGMAVQQSPYFESEDEIPVADFRGRFSGKRRYREQLEKRYGKRLMLFSGIHFNFSFDDEYLKTLCGGEAFEDHKSRFYLKLYKQLSIHSWLLLMLTAASPWYDRSFDACGGSGAVNSGYGSMRSGDRGYWNEFVPLLRHGSLDEFADSIGEYVDSGRIWSASEIYLPVRLKPKGVNTLEGLRKGVSHIELRMFDLDPTQPLGVDKRALEFAHLLIMYLSKQPDLDYTEDMQRQAVRDHKNAALYDLRGVTVDGVPMTERAAEILDDMRRFFSGDSHAAAVIEYEKERITDRLCESIAAEEVYGNG